MAIPGRPSRPWRRRRTSGVILLGSGGFWEVLDHRYGLEAEVEVTEAGDEPIKKTGLKHMVGFQLVMGV